VRCFHAGIAGSLTHKQVESVCCSSIAYGFEEAYGFEFRTESTMAAAADAAGTAAAAVLGLVEESEEESIDADDPPLDEEAIEELQFEFQSSVERVFDYTELTADSVSERGPGWAGMRGFD
jgi:hypothetical protein